MTYTATKNGIVNAIESDLDVCIEDTEKLPVWLRVVVIVGLSTGLWAGIIVSISALI